MTRGEKYSALVVVVGAWVLRVSPFLRPTGVLGWPVDYDEGVYVSAAGAIAHGSLPWRDFAFLHPAGMVWLLLPFTLLGPIRALIWARVAVTVIGACTTLVIFRVVHRQVGFAGAIVSAALYATWPEAVLNERRVLLEPALNLVALTALLFVDRQRLSSALLGFALAIKSWGLFWYLGVIGPRAPLRHHVIALGVFLAVCSIAFFAPTKAFEQLVLVHLSRPPDGDLSRFVRIREMFVARTCVPAVLVLLTSPWLWKLRANPTVRALGIAFALFVGAFLSSAAWWNQYDTALAAVVAPLAGLGVGAFWGERWRPLLAFPLALVLSAPGLTYCIDRRHDEAPDQLQNARLVRDQTKPTERLCGFDAIDVVLAGRWPAALVDSYGQQLVDARAAEGRFTTIDAAFAAEESQTTIRKALDHCDEVLVGWRGQWQMNAATKKLLLERFDGVDSVRFRRK
jgi:hypothetical protein